MSEDLYFIAVLPPQEIQEEITLLKEEVADKFDSRHALRSPPHITLHMPFKWKEKKIDQLLQVIDAINADISPFEIELKDFGFFDPRVVYVDVISNNRLALLQKQVVDGGRKELKLDNANYRNKPFHPHVTIGFRDLKKSMFYEAKSYYQKQQVNFVFTVERIYLLKHDGKRWNVMETESP